jgi:uncharacterized protein GlcG (DUF336 family)
MSPDEVIALGAVVDYAVPSDKRGDNIFLDGVRLLYANTAAPPREPPVADLAPLGTFITPIPSVIPAGFLCDEGFVCPLQMTGCPPEQCQPTGGSLLTAADVTTIIMQARNQANQTRAAIRRPIGSPARVFISVVDIDGSILGIYRTFDATIFSFDVSVQKARTALAFSDPANTAFGDSIRIILDVSSDQPLAISTRAVGFLSQDFFPPGIDRNTLGDPVEPGPLFEGDCFDYQARIGLMPFGNGITIFPGGLPLYKNGQLAGAIGVSGDGVDQDDLIAFTGSIGFEPPESIRCDQFFYNEVRLPFVKFPRSPGIE